ncbi:hypothetical protein [Roseomonas sp. BN140053]|uniref:hypothetical protein n=1 Tax=Roseomonas sp. BN140053 TaxID=3391898 RepID=UPI0039E8644D
MSGSAAPSLSDTTGPLDPGEVLALDEALRGTASPGFGVTGAGFAAKPFARLLAEKLALARALLGPEADLSSGSVLRKLLEITALEDARHWAALAATYDDLFVSSARGAALTALGEELGLPRPRLPATGRVALVLAAALPAGVARLTLPRGLRLLTPGGHHAALTETAVLDGATPRREVAVEAFIPGPSHNLDPVVPAQKLDRVNPTDPLAADLLAAEQAAGERLLTVEHTAALAGGEQGWPDLRYRQLLLRAPRSIWTAAAVETAVSLVPGVRQVQVADLRGGLDLGQSIFGNFNFIERLFGTERDLASPYYVTVLVAPTPAAIWSGPDGLRAAVEAAVEDVRPVGIYPNIQMANEVGVGVAAKLVVRGLPLPTGNAATVNGSAAAAALRARLHQRLQRYVDSLPFGEPVRVSEVIWTLMSEPGIADARDVRLLRFPSGTGPAGQPQELPVGANLDPGADSIPAYVDLDAPVRLDIV